MLGGDVERIRGRWLSVEVGANERGHRVAERNGIGFWVGGRRMGWKGMGARGVMGMLKVTVDEGGEKKRGRESEREMESWMSEEELLC
jgi:hypothetical protein